MYDLSFDFQYSTFDFAAMQSILLFDSIESILRYRRIQCGLNNTLYNDQVLFILFVEKYYSFYSILVLSV